MDKKQIEHDLEFLTLDMMGLIIIDRVCYISNTMGYESGLLGKSMWFFLIATIGIGILLNLNIIRSKK